MGDTIPGGATTAGGVTGRARSAPGAARAVSGRPDHRDGILRAERQADRDVRLRHAPRALADHWRCLERTVRCVPMDPLLLARWQFAITTVYHFLFVPLTISLAFIVAGFQTAWYRTGKEHYLRLTRFF